MTQRIGLFGGSFDPVHNAHLALADAALLALKLDELRWIPAGQPWQKTRRLADAADREAMVRLAIAGKPCHVLDRTELRHGGASYTLDTVRALAVDRPDANWFLVLGRDQYAGLQTWHDWRELLDRVTVAVADRPGASLAIDEHVAQWPHEVVPLPMLEVSSTEVRRRVAAGEPIEGLVPASVARYIDQHRLYRSAG